VLLVAKAHARRSLALALAALLTCLISAPARAEQTVTVLVLEPVQPDMLQRVQGQLADKAARVQAVQGSGKTAVEGAFRAAEEHGAALVVWFTSPPKVTVSVLDVRQKRLIERDVPPPRAGEVMAQSARDEAAAFIVRGAVDDFNEGRSVGRPVEAPPPEPQFRPDEVMLGPAPVPPRWHVLGGAYAVADGLALLRGPELGLYVRGPRLNFGASLRHSFSSMVERSGFSLDVSRSDLRAFGEYRFFATSRVDLAVGAELGPSLHQRTTRSVPDGYVVAPRSLQPDLFLRVFGAATFRLTRNGVRLRAALGLEATPGDRELLVRGRAQPLDSAWPVQPHAQLSGLFPLHH
jgi:hypothetical protein